MTVSRQAPQRRDDWAEAVLETHSWLTQRNVSCVLSPDSDGFLCGLLVTNLLGWRIAGFYDGKVMAIRSDVSVTDCAFVDIEINRPVLGSVGHHIISYNNRVLPLPHFQFPDCIQPNQLRGIDGKNFQCKYPFGTTHLLITLFHRAGLLGPLSADSTVPLLFTDGVWNNVFGYTENCLDWLTWLGVGEPRHPLTITFQRGTSIYDVMRGLDAFLRQRDGFNATGTYVDGSFHLGGRNKRTGDKLRLSRPDGAVVNLEALNGKYRVHSLEQERILGFISLLAKMMEWPYLAERWSWDGLLVRAFTKGVLSGVNNRSFATLIDKNPVSLAMTSSAEIEYTLDPQGLF
jgi:hypothetical protein